MACGCCDSSTSVAAGCPAMHFAPACLRFCMQPSTCECLGARCYITLSATVKLHAACSPLPLQYHHRFPPPSEPFIQIVLPRIPRQRRSEEEGEGKNPSEERLCTLGVAVSLHGREWARWGEGVGRRERRWKRKRRGRGLKRKGKEPAVPLSRTCC